MYKGKYKIHIYNFNDFERQLTVESKKGSDVFSYVFIAYVKVKCMSKLAKMRKRNWEYNVVRYSHYK